MPYKILKTTGPRKYKIYKGLKLVGSSKTLKDAQASVKARYAGENK